MIPLTRCLPVMRWTMGLVIAAGLLGPVHGLEKERLHAQTTGVQESTDDTWQVIYIGDHRIGYGHTTTRSIDRQGRTVVRTDSKSRMKFKRLGDELILQMFLVTEETESGNLLSFELEIRNPPAATTKTTGRVEGERMLIESKVAGRTSKRTIPWNANIKSPNWQDRFPRVSALEPGQSFSFQAFSPELIQNRTVRFSVDGPRFVKLLDGNRRKLLRVRVSQAQLPTLYGYLDDKGRALKSETDFLGQSLITYTVPKEDALKAIAGAELDIAVKTLVRVSPIRNAHQTRKVVYRITTPGEDPTKILVRGLTQQVKKLDAETAELTVIAVPIPEYPQRIRVAGNYLGATRFLQTTDPRVIEHAQRASSGELNPSRIAVRMERYVRTKLANKNFSTALASAAEVARSLEGDCTEHAVLLAAMLRVQKIPSRIAVGLVYIERRSSFGGHMWTEAYLDGKWIPLDATLGRGGIGAAHIKLAESDFADDAPAPVTAFLPLLKVLGKMKIEVVESR